MIGTEPGVHVPDPVLLVERRRRDARGSLHEDDAPAAAGGGGDEPDGVELARLDVGQDLIPVPDGPVTDLGETAEAGEAAFAGL